MDVARQPFLVRLDLTPPTSLGSTYRLLREIGQNVVIMHSRKGLASPARVPLALTGGVTYASHASSLNEINYREVSWSHRVLLAVDSGSSDRQIRGLHEFQRRCRLQRGIVSARGKGS